MRTRRLLDTRCTDVWSRSIQRLISWRYGKVASNNMSIQRVQQVDNNLPPLVLPNEGYLGSLHAV